MKNVGSTRYTYMCPKEISTLKFVFEPFGSDRSPICVRPSVYPFVTKCLFLHLSDSNLHLDLAFNNVNHKDWFFVFD